MEPWIEIRPLPDTPGLSRRVAERAAWRSVVRERLGEGVATDYNKNGAPVLKRAPMSEGVPVSENAPGYISVSHTKGWVAVVWSPAPCAIDIELRERVLLPAAAARYGIATMEDWCALEVRYKFTGLTGREPAAGSVRFLPHSELIVAVIS